MADPYASGGLCNAQRAGRPVFEAWEYLQSCNRLLENAPSKSLVKVLDIGPFILFVRSCFSDVWRHSQPPPQSLTEPQSRYLTDEVQPFRKTCDAWRKLWHRSPSSDQGQ